MALEMSITDKFGNSHTNAYFRVVVVNADWRDRNVEILVHGFKDLAAHDSDLRPVEIINLALREIAFDTYFSTTILSEVNKNVVERAYVYIKTLAKFERATDV